jgi:hypothetical protein
MGAPGSLALPPRGAAVDVFCVDGGRSRISGTASQGVSSTFLALMVDVLGFLVSPPREPTVNVFCVDGGRSRISGITFQGPTVDVLCIDGGRSRISSIAS